MADIFREVEEDLRRDNLEKLWKKYGRAAIVAAVAVVVGVAGAQIWRGYELRRDQEMSNRFADALREAQIKTPAAALPELTALADEGGGYASLAALERARVLAASGDRAGAIETWERIAADGDVEPSFRAVATLMAVLHQIDDGDPADLRTRLAPLMAGGSAFRGSALELMAVLALREGDQAGARDFYTQIVDDPGSPSGLRARAAQMLAALKE